MTLEKHFMKLVHLKKDKLHIKKFKQIFFYTFITNMKLFLLIITLTLIFHDHLLVEYPLLDNFPYVNGIEKHRKKTWLEKVFT